QARSVRRGPGELRLVPEERLPRALQLAGRAAAHAAGARALDRAPRARGAQEPRAAAARAGRKRRGVAAPGRRVARLRRALPEAARDPEPARLLRAGAAGAARVVRAARAARLLLRGRRARAPAAALPRQPLARPRADGAGAAAEPDPARPAALQHLGAPRGGSRDGDGGADDERGALRRAPAQPRARVRDDRA